MLYNTYLRITSVDRNGDDDAYDSQHKKHFIGMQLWYTVLYTSNKGRNDKGMAAFLILFKFQHIDCPASVSGMTKLCQKMAKQ